MEQKKIPVSERIRAVQLLRQSNFDYPTIARTLMVPEMTLHRWNDKYGPTVKDAIASNQDPVEVVVDADLEFKETNSDFMRRANKVKRLALERLEVLVPKETNVKNLIETVKALNEITNALPDKPSGGSYFLQIIEKQYLTKHGNKDRQPADPGDAAESAG